MVSGRSQQVVVSGRLPSAPLKWKRASQSAAIDHAAAREVPSFKPSRGLSGTAIATLAKSLERELCEQLLHFSRAVGEPYLKDERGI
jgi:Ser/Thr protein kinase RdoA (MazF antagonist)